jgi:hypothetical protein
MALSLEDVYKILGVKELPGIPEHKDFLIESTENILKRNGKEWMEQHRGLLLKSWEHLVNEML